MFRVLRKSTESIPRPVFGIRPRELNVNKLGTKPNDMNVVELGYQLRDAYHHDLLKAVVVVMGSKVIVMNDQNKSEGVKRNWSFVRDPVVIFPDINLMIYTEGNIPYGAIEIVNRNKEMMGYEALEIEDAYLEGGNTFYSPHKKVVLHGLDPYGLYKYQIPPAETNQKLSEKLVSYGITVLGLKWGDKLKHHEYGYAHSWKYYHLDCFMQLLPDGRILILNKEMLSPDSQNKMQEIFGDDFIDLAYSDYLSKPVLLNFISVADGNKISIVSPSLPDSVIKSLRNLNLKVITPETIDSRSAEFDKEFASRVATEVQNEGYKTADAMNLTTHLPKNVNGYVLDNGTKLPADIIDRALGPYCMPLDQGYSSAKVSFEYGHGGPHCLISDIAPCIISPENRFFQMSEAKKVRPDIMTNTDTHLVSPLMEHKYG